MSFYGIQFDRQDAPDYPDYLFGSKKRKKKRQEAAQTTIKQILDSPNAQNLSDTTIMTLVYGADGKLTGKEKRAIAKTTRQKEKTARTTERQVGRTDRTRERQSAMTDRTKTRQDAKTERTGLETASVGGQPTTGQGELIKLDPVSQGQSAVSALSGGGGGGIDIPGMGTEIPQDAWNEQADMQEQAEGEDPVKQPDEQGTGGKKSLFIIVAIAAVAIFLFMRKK